MSIDEPGGPTMGRRPGMTGKLMLDVSKGVERVRKWPRKRGKNLPPETLEQMEWFRQAQKASQYWPAFMQADIAAAVKGTPLLPRDIMTMIMANRMFAIILPNGRKIYPMKARQDVSESLDILSQIPGSLLVRGEDFWTALIPGLPGEVLMSTGSETVPNWQPLGSLAPLYERLRIIPDLANFTLLNPGAGINAAVAAQTPFGVTLRSPAVTTNVRMLAWNPALPAAPYSVYIRSAPLTPTVNTTRLRCSCYVRNSANGRIIHYSFSNNGIVVQRQSSYTAFHSSVLAEEYSLLMPATPWARIEITATHIIFYSSPDGEAWDTIVSEPIAFYIGAVDQVGWGNLPFGGRVSDILQSFQVV